jgi:hypothetical protein
MCVSKSRGEAETFILAGDYMFLKSYPLSNNGQDITVFEFLQIDSGFNGIRPDDIDQENFNQKKEELRDEIKHSFPSFDQNEHAQSSQEERGIKNIFSKGGLTRRRTNKKRNRIRVTKKRNRRRRTNKKKF